MPVQSDDGADRVGIEHLRRRNRFDSHGRRHDDRLRRRIARCTQRAANISNALALTQDPVDDAASRPIRKARLACHGTLDERTQLLTR
jgi:hypothetical protein